MGKLFWRFFAVFVLAQVLTSVGLAVLFWLKHQNQEVRSLPPIVYVEATSATLMAAGPQGVAHLIAGWGQPGTERVFVVDAQGKDVLGRTLPAHDNLMRREVTDAQGAKYEVLIVPQPDEKPGIHLGGIDARPTSGQSAAAGLGGPRERKAGEPPWPGPGPGLGPGQDGGPPAHQMGPGGPFLPVEPVIAGIVVSIIFAWVAAWRFSIPFRAMHRAFERASNGSLSVRLSPEMKGRNDEFADLGRGFDHMVERIQGLMDGQRRLLHDVSHELRSPLARLQLAAGLARQQPDKIAVTLDRVEHEAQRMDALIDELLTLSRLEAGVFSADTEKVPMLDLLEGIVEDARFEASAADRDISFTHGGQVLIEGRAELLQRAVENVVRNAITHTEAETCVWVDARVHDDGLLHITIDDEGPGIPEDSLSSVFRPFYRAPGSQGRKGHGLGLAIAREVVEAHGGTIAAMNRSKGGLRVEIVLPVARDRDGDGDGSRA